MRKELVDYIKSHRLMQIATASKSPWICTVYYATDDEMNIYFISNPKTRHCLDIKKNRNVACAISESTQKVTDKKIGVQIGGVASELTSDKDIQMAISIWNRANPGLEKFINIQAVRNGKMSDRPFIIRPSSIKFFNEKLYGLEGFEIFKVE